MSIKTGRAHRLKARCLIVASSLALLWSGAVQAASEPRVLLLRGWFGVFSTGMDHIADDLKARGIKAEAIGHLSWKAQVARIIQERQAGKTGPIVLVGHSQGANNVIEMAEMLNAQNIKVDLLVTLAPMLQDAVPGNVVRAVNYYQAPGWGAPISGDGQFRGQLANVDLASDISVSHVTIDKSARVQGEILREISAAVRAR